MRSNVHSVNPEEVMAYLDGELPAERAAEVADHLHECGECKILAAEFRSVSEGLTLWELPATPAEISGELAKALDEHEAKASDGGWRRWLGGFRRRTAFQLAGGALVGSVAAILILTALVFRFGEEKHASPVLMQQAARPETTAQGVVGGVPGGVPSGKAGSVQDFYNRQLAASLNDSQRAEMLKRKEMADQASNLEVAAPAAIPRQPSGGNRDAIPPAPMILRSAQITVVTPNLDQARAGMDQIVVRFGGYVGDLSASAPSDGPRKLTATLRIPAGQLDAALAEVKKLGRVESESQNGQDVTAQYVDLQARLSNSRNTERRLIDLLGQRTGKLSDVLEVETELSRVREEIERMEGERRLMAKQVEFATVAATISEEYKAAARPLPDSLGTRFHNAAVDGYESVVNFILGVALFVISDGPMLVVWAAILFFPARWAWRKWRRSQTDQ
jgi:anti-sigma factor RsiW